MNGGFFEGVPTLRLVNQRFPKHFQEDIAVGATLAEPLLKQAVALLRKHAGNEIGPPRMSREAAWALSKTMTKMMHGAIASGARAAGGGFKSISERQIINRAGGAAPRWADTGKEARVRGNRGFDGLGMHFSLAESVVQVTLFDILMSPQNERLKGRRLDLADIYAFGAATALCNQPELDGLDRWTDGESALYLAGRAAVRSLGHSLGAWCWICFLVHDQKRKTPIQWSQEQWFKALTRYDSIHSAIYKQFIHFDIMYR